MLDAYSWDVVCVSKSTLCFLFVLGLQAVALKLNESGMCLLSTLFQVVALMGTDLLRQQPRWKEVLLEMRQIVVSLVQQVTASSGCQPQTQMRKLIQMFHAVDGCLSLVHQCTNKHWL